MYLVEMALTGLSPHEPAGRNGLLAQLEPAHPRDKVAVSCVTIVSGKAGGTAIVAAAKIVPPD